MNLEQPLAIQGQQTSSGLHRQQQSFMQQTVRNQPQAVNFERQERNGGSGKGTTYHKTATAQASAGGEAAMLKTLVVSKRNDDGAGDRESLRGSQSKVRLKNSLRLADRAELAGQHP